MSTEKTEIDLMKDEIAKTFGELGATSIVWKDDDGNVVNKLECKEPPPSTPILGHGDPVTEGDLVLITHVSGFGVATEEGIFRINRCWKDEHEKDTWHMLIEREKDGEVVEHSQMSRGVDWAREFMLIERGGPLEVKYCCQAMRADLNYECKEHPNRFECPDVLMYFNADDGVYGIVICDGGESWRSIAYCPWCGTKL